MVLLQYVHQLADVAVSQSQAAHVALAKFLLQFEWSHFQKLISDGAQLFTLFLRF